MESFVYLEQGHRNYITVPSQGKFSEQMDQTALQLTGLKNLIQ